MYIDRRDASRRIKTALVRITKKPWRVYGDRGTAYGWLTIHAPASRCVADLVNGDASSGHGPYLVNSDRLQLGGLLNMDRPVHAQGYSIPPNSREWVVARLEEMIVPREAR